MPAAAGRSGESIRRSTPWAASGSTTRCIEWLPGRTAPPSRTRRPRPRRHATSRARDHAQRLDLTYSTTQDHDWDVLHAIFVIGSSRARPRAFTR
jgi:hypothetical protein